MIVDIPYRDGDDKRFLTAINGLVAIIVKDCEPEDVYVVRINKWFDHKWLRYSGAGTVQFPERGVDAPRTGNIPFELGAAKDEFYNEKLTFPPFSPKQVGIQVTWRRREDGTYGRVNNPKLLHKRILQPSKYNLQNRLSSFAKSGIFIWFSSNTLQNKHGCVLVYVINNDEEKAWYASFKEDNGWKVNQVKGTNKETVQNRFPIG
jgi:hypothetical protein